uniref:Uncharacterized protein n=1 Tax=Rhizophagus irregularis (strain DAOM 181602 / DAOM 197198 / MUCL 43194) TaxID=747089 RepID=U9SU90_RHIID
MTLLTRTTSLVTNKIRKRRALRSLRKNCIRIKGNTKINVYNKFDKDSLDEEVGVITGIKPFRVEVNHAYWTYLPCITSDNFFE